MSSSGRSGGYTSKGGCCADGSTVYTGKGSAFVARGVGEGPEAGHGPGGGAGGGAKAGRGGRGGRAGRAAGGGVGKAVGGRKGASVPTVSKDAEKAMARMPTAVAKKAGKKK